MKRRGERDAGSLDAPEDDDRGHFAGPQVTTTRSRVASAREQAAAMQLALGRDVRDFLRLRLFEERTVAEVAAELGLGESAVRHRLRRGAMEYARLLARTTLERSRGAELAVSIVGGGASADSRRHVS
ncbi:MAG: hypothetical protein IPM29_15840 [Planctomycetes bacterium]|nr:hypothetical protein [Planctomycetota bacterium]